MRTVKEIADLTGISVRTLHYYDEIGLLKPTKTSEAGYRLYDDKALEKLKQILFFREFDIPLQEIKTVLDTPALDINQVLQMQRGMLAAKKERIERLIASIDDILKGDNKMDFAVFDKNDIENLYQSIMENIPEEQRQRFMKSFVEVSAELSEEEKKSFRENGSAEKFHELFVKSASGEQAQKNFRDAIMKKLAAKRGADVTAFEVKELIGEYDFVSKQLYQMKDVKTLMLELAGLYRSNDLARAGNSFDFLPSV